MTQEQEKALKIVEKLIDRVGKHDLTSEEIMILVQGIMSNDCGGCNWKYVQAPNYQPGLEPGIQPGWKPGEVWCGDNLNISLYAEKCTTNELPKRFKNEQECLVELNKKLEEQGYAENPIKFENDNMWKINTTSSTICAGDNIPDMQYKIH